MIRIALLLLAVVACKREPQSTGSHSATPHKDASSGSATDAATDGSGATGAGTSGTVDLLRAVGTRVAVSSVVQNLDITPFDLVDGDLNTAWNSRTGQLVGAWIAVRLPPAAHVTQIEMTAGFVSSGPEGDYFTGNPRIKHVAIWRNGTKLVEKDLDITIRGLQSIPIGNEGGDYKIEVTAIEPGTMKNWRETCVSELRVIGSAPGMRPGRFAPDMTIGSLDGKLLDDPALYLLSPKSYATIKDYCAEFAAAAHDSVTTCGDKIVSDLDLPSPLPAGWTAQWFGSTTTNKTGIKWTDRRCNLAIEAKGRIYVLDRFAEKCAGAQERMSEIQDRAKLHSSRAQISLVDIAGTPDVDLAIVTTRGTEEWLTLCVPTSTGVPACAEKQIAELEHHNDSGGDQFDEWYEYKWKLDYRLGGGYLSVDGSEPQPIRVLE